VGDWRQHEVWIWPNDGSHPEFLGFATAPSWSVAVDCVIARHRGLMKGYDRHVMTVFGCELQ
jgi:hypothetical protein